MKYEDEIQRVKAAIKELTGSACPIPDAPHLALEVWKACAIAQIDALKSEAYRHMRAGVREELLGKQS